MALVPVGIALGSNMGNPSEELDAGIVFLRTLSTYDRIRESHRIVTTPVDCPPNSQSFLNSVAEIEVEPEIMPPHELLKQLQAFELSRGRPPEREPNSPRPLDLDIIYYGDWVVYEQSLVIPHPYAVMRWFVLEPLSHLQPDLILPGQTKTIRQLLEECVT